MDNNRTAITESDDMISAGGAPSHMPILIPKVECLNLRPLEPIARDPRQKQAIQPPNKDDFVEEENEAPAVGIDDMIEVKMEQVGGSEKAPSSIGSNWKEQFLNGASNVPNEAANVSIDQSTSTNFFPVKQVNMVLNLN